VVENFTVDAPRTKLLAEKLRGMGLDDVLIITDRVDDNLRLSSRNLPNVEVLTVGEADPLSLMQFARVLVTRGAVAKIEELLK
jgi:large subunit ribosomal protein L4